jgi:hypothetical protein
MAIQQRFDTTESMSLEDFVEHARRHTDFSDEDSQLALGQQLTMLGNNREFLTAFMGDYIERHLAKDRVEGTISQAFLLATGPDFYLRCAFWLPESELTGNESILYAYHQAHDHNFDFLSYAYCGSGYRTDLYEYDYASTAGYIGEKVKLKPLGNHLHRTGDVLFYRCNKDIHFQRPPETPSITINVIPLVNQHGLKDQYFFDIAAADSEEGTIYRHAEGNIESRRTLFEIVKHFRSPKLTRVLAEFAESYACQRSRYQALRALQACDPETHRDVCNRLAGDASAIVRRHVNDTLAA